MLNSNEKCIIDMTMQQMVGNNVETIYESVSALSDVPDIDRNHLYAP
jgi:hypothetical protein